MPNMFLIQSSFFFDGLVTSFGLVASFFLSNHPIDKAVDAGFIECVQVPRAKQKGRGPTVGEYRIQWSDDQSTSFCGFRTFEQRLDVVFRFKGTQV